MECKSRDEKKHIITKDVVGFLLGEVVSTKKHTSLKRMWLACFSRRGSKYKKKHILAKNEVGLLVGDNEDLIIISQN